MESATAAAAVSPSKVENGGDPQALPGLRRTIQSVGEVLPQAEEESFDLQAITISSSTPEPISIDGTAEMIKFLQSGTFKGIENTKLRERFIRSITMPRVGKIVRLSFYFILVSNFPECVRFDEEETTCAALKARLSKNYVKMFSALPQPKDEIVNMVIFCVGYTCHLLFYKLFPKQREMFDLRFVFNCYHILIFEFNGIFVSDFFVRMNIDKIFVQHKFLDYERVNKKNMLLQQQAKNKIKTKTFFGFPLAFPDMHNSQDAFTFNKSLQDKFKPSKKNLHILEDPAAEQASSQEKQIKIRQELRNKRRKQIEESELSKITLITRQLAPILESSFQQTLLADASAEAVTDEINSSQLPQQQQQQQLQQHLVQSNFEQLSHSQASQPPQQQQQHQQQQLAMKQAMEKADAIFARTEVRYDDPHSTKEDANYFANLQLNCNQISPTISSILSYDNRTLPYAKKKMIRHAFETVNDKEDNLLQQLKQFSQSRKQKKETKLTQKVNKSIIDHFGLRPPPREYYQKHPKLDKMFKDMLDINYVLKQNTESMLQLPSSIAMQSEQANEWQQQIIDQENNYNKQNQRQKVSNSLSEIVLKNQNYHLEKRPGYRKKYIYTKPTEFIKQQELDAAHNKQYHESIHKNTLTPNPITNTATQLKIQIASTEQTNIMDEVLRNVSTVAAMLGSPMKSLGGTIGGAGSGANTFSLPSLSATGFGGGQLSNGGSSAGVGGIATIAGATAGGSNNGMNEKKKGGQIIAENPNPHRNIEFKSYERESKNTGRGYYEEESETIEQRILKNKQNSDFYNDKRRQYKDTYKGFINNMSTDNNIDDILQNILHKRNQFNRNLRSKIKNL